MIIVNRTKAEHIILDKLRVQREPLLAALDLEFMRTLEQGGDTPQIVQQKQALRDVTEKDLSDLSLAELATLDIEKSLSL